MRTLRGLVAVTGCLLLVALRPPVAAADPGLTKLCQAGEKLRDAKVYDQAIATFFEALKANPDASCASLGIIVTVQARAAAATPPTPAPENPCQVADALRALGYRDDARAAYLKALPDAVKAKSPCAKTGLHKDSWERLGDFLEVAWPRIALAAGVLLLLLAAVPVFLTYGGRRKYRSFLSRFKLTRWVFRPKVLFSAFDSSGASSPVGASLGAMVRSELLAFRAAEQEDDLFDPAIPKPDLGIVTAFDEVPDVLGGVTDIDPKFKVLASLVGYLQQILPFIRLTVDGTLSAPIDRGGGVTVSLADQKRVSVATTIWELPGDAAPLTDKAKSDLQGDHYNSLTAPVAAWLYHSLSEVVVNELIAVTPSADSYALFRGGLAVQRLGRLDDARGWYEEALDIDGDNWAALSNLGTIAGLQGRWGEAIDWIMKAEAARLG